MLAKLLAVTAATGAIALGLLVCRQQRIEAAHDMSTLHRQLLEDERLLWSLRQEVGDRTSPEHIRAMVDRLGGEWKAVPAEPTPIIDDHAMLVGEHALDTETEFGG